MFRVTIVTVSLLTLSAVSSCPDFNPDQCATPCHYGYKIDGNGCATCNCKSGDVGSLYQEDIILTNGLKALLEDGPTSHRKRGAGSLKYFHLWKEYPDQETYLVPYQLPSNVNPKLKEAVDGAAKLYADNTCIRLVPKTSEHSNYVKIIDEGGCNSGVGMFGGEQTMTLGDKSGAGDTCKKTFIAFHEFMHIIGFLHEQMRPDRDDYVKIHFENIDPKAVSNFEKFKEDEIDSLGSPYDINSIMHYPGYHRSTNGKPTITSLASGLPIGKNESPSAVDYAQINTLYGC